jgi:hypothetical protein
VDRIVCCIYVREAAVAELMKAYLRFRHSGLQT